METGTPGSGLRLMQFFKEPANQTQYAEWLRLPMTQAAIRMTEESIRPVMKPDTMPAARYGGLVDGRYEVLRLITGLDQIYKAVEAARAPAPEETYGVQESLISQFGYNENEARKILALHAQQKLPEEQ